MTKPLIILGKIVSLISRFLNLGSGGTWPGEIALTFNPQILRFFSDKVKKGIIIIAGTNGKTTTSLMIKKILEKEGDKVIHNASGANLLNGVVSSFIEHARWDGKIDADWGVFEVDENSLPIVLRELEFYSSSERSEARSKFSTSSNNKRLILVFLNLFRDQLDRYGEVDVIAEKWSKALKELPRDAKIILNADDPLIASLSKSVSSTPGVEATYFGLDDPKLFQKQMEHATDSIFCLNCGGRLSYDGIYYSHLGVWKCTKCGLKRPKLSISEWKSLLPGVYNKYNVLAAVSTAKSLGISDNTIKKSLENFSPAFGRQEEFEIDGKKVKIFLSKNPAGYNEALRTVLSLGAGKILFVLNDRIPDGRDVSWIWDADFEMLPAYITPVVSGDRAYDLELRIKYSRPMHKLPKGAVSAPQTPILVYEDLQIALDFCIGSTGSDETLYILPTYSAMLEVRKILKGKKIL